MVLYGELFGGHYPHPAVPPEQNVPTVQTGVWYAPGLHWSVFDAVVNVRGEQWWVGDAVLRRAAAAAGLRCAPLLGEGPLVRLQELPAAFPTRVPAQHFWLTPEITAELTPDDLCHQPPFSSHPEPAVSPGIDNSSAPAWHSHTEPRETPPPPTGPAPVPVGQHGADLTRSRSCTALRRDRVAWCQAPSRATSTFNRRSRTLATTAR